MKTMVDYTEKIKPYFEGVAPIEPTTTASEPHSIGDKFYLDGTLVEVTANISANDTITIGTNVKLADDVETQVGSLKQALNDLEDNLTGEVVDSEAYVLRQGKGNMVDMELVGGSVAWNQLIKNGNFANTNYWIGENGTISASNNVLTVKATVNSGGCTNASEHRAAVFKDHKYFVTFDIQTDGGNTYHARWYMNSNGVLTPTIAEVNTKQRISNIINCPASSISTASGLRFAEWDTKESDWADVKLSNIFSIDLTALFGSSTIADYIYSLEQATAGAGIEWLRKYCPSIFTYHGYNVGQLQHVNPSARKVVGKNLLNPSTFKNGLLSAITGVAASSSEWITSDYVYVGDSEEVTIQGWRNGSESNFCVRFVQYDVNKQFIQNVSNLNISSEAHYQNVVTLNPKTRYIRASFGFDNKTTTIANFFAINDIQLEFGSTATEYEPYQEYTFPFANKQLRGIFYLDANNKLCANGDIWKANEGITRKYGIVDLGTLNWYSNETSISSKYKLYSNSLQSIIKKVASDNDLSNVICAKYETITATSVQSANVGIAITTGGTIRVYDDNYNTSSSASAFKTAMSGVYLVYELATPTTETAEPFQNPQRAFVDGTEEFIYDNEVAVPVGNNSTYYLNETLPQSEDYTDGAVKILNESKATIEALGDDESGNTTASQAYSAGDYFYKDGKMYKAKTSIASGATFTVGTNCEETTIFAELKALAQ